MTSFFPDLNVWLALTVSGHMHSQQAWRWLEGLPSGAQLRFCRYTQIGLLRLLTNSPVMGEQTLSLSKAWSVYDAWLKDVRVEFYPEPRGIDAAFREATGPFNSQPASKVVGDCYLLAYAKHTHSVLVTFDATLHSLGGRQGCASVKP